MTDEGSQVGKVVRAALLASLAAASVAACAGGGGGGGGSLPPPPITPPPPPAPPPPGPPPPPPPPPSFFETPEYSGSAFQSNNRTGLPQIGASTAYSQGATGQGIIVAVIDTGVDTTISELTGQIVASHDVNAASRSATDIDTDGHGTMVSGVIVANRNGTGTHGVAYEAKVLNIRADTPGTCQQTGEDEGCRFNDNAVANAINYAVNNGAKIINLSLGGEIDANQVLENAIRSAAARGVLVVIAAGNDGVAPTADEPAEGTSPSEPAYIAGEANSLGRVVAVGAVDRNGAMPTFSNRAGQTQNFYLLAPGVSVIVPGVDDNVRLPDNPTCSATVTTGCNDTDDAGDYWSASGTSFAAPHVAGALALMLDLFPNITPEAALQALLTTADDYVTTTPDAILGVNAAAGADPVGGRGILNLARAFSPIGASTVSFDGKPVELERALGPASGALGDWAANSGAFDGIVFQDSFQRGFRIATTQMLSSAAPFGDFGIRADYARGQARAFEMGPARMSWFSAPRPVYDPRAPWADNPDPTFQFSYAFGDTRVSIGRGGGAERLTPGLSLVEDISGPPVLGAGDSWTSVTHAIGQMTFDARTSEGSGRSARGIGVGTAGEDWAVRLGYASLHDSSTALGGALQSRFGGDDQTRMNALSLEARRDLGAWTVSGMVEAADIRIDRMNVSGLWTSAWSLSAEHPLAGGALRFTAGQPRRSEGGALAFSAPIEVTRSGRLVYESRIAGLTPSGRELDFEAAWITRLGAMTTLEATAALATQPNHVANADPEAAFWLSLRHAW